MPLLKFQPSYICTGKKSRDAKFVASTGIVLKISGFWKGIWCRLVNDDIQTKNSAIEMSVTIYPSTRHNISQDLILQKDTHKKENKGELCTPMKYIHHQNTFTVVLYTLCLSTAETNWLLQTAQFAGTENIQTLHPVKYSTYWKIFHINLEDMKDIYTVTSYTICRRTNHIIIIIYIYIYFFFFWKLGTEFRFLTHTRYLMIMVFRYVAQCRFEDRLERFGWNYCLNLQRKTHFHISFPKIGFEDCNANKINTNLIL